MIVGGRDSAINARALVHSDYGGNRLWPLLLSDGTFALPPEVQTDPKYAAAVATLAGWLTATPLPGDYIPASSGSPQAFRMMVDGKYMHHSGRTESLTMPDPAVFRFEARVNDFQGFSGDSANQNRRSELVADGSDRGIGVGTLWSAFCLILGDHDGLSKVRSGPLGLVHQWHSVDIGIGRGPVLFVDCSNNVMAIRTASSASLDAGQNGIAVTRYSTSIPAKGTKTYFVFQATFGQTGHLNAWVNGTQVVNADTPIGYYNDLTDGSGRTELGYPHWGLYTRNQSETDVVYIANPEWGTGSLSARISTPLAVPDLTW